MQHMRFFSVRCCVVRLIFQSDPSHPLKLLEPVLSLLLAVRATTAGLLGELSLLCVSLLDRVCRKVRSLSSPPPFRCFCSRLTGPGGGGGGVLVSTSAGTPSRSASSAAGDRLLSTDACSTVRVVGRATENETATHIECRYTVDECYCNCACECDLLRKRLWLCSV